MVTKTTAGRKPQSSANTTKARKPLNVKSAEPISFTPSIGDVVRHGTLNRHGLVLDVSEDSALIANSTYRWRLDRSRWSELSLVDHDDPKATEVRNITQDIGDKNPFATVAQELSDALHVFDNHLRACDLEPHHGQTADALLHVMLGFLDEIEDLSDSIEDEWKEGLYPFRRRPWFEDGADVQYTFRPRAREVKQ